MTLLVLTSVNAEYNWTQTNKYNTNVLNGYSVGSSNPFWYGSLNQCISMGDSQTSYRHGFCWDGSEWVSNSKYELDHWIYKYQMGGDHFIIDNKEIIISVTRWQQYPNPEATEILEWIKGSSYSIPRDPTYTVGLPTTGHGIYDLIISVDYLGTNNLINVKSSSGLVYGYTWNGSSWVTNSTIINNFVSSFGLITNGYPVATSQNINNTPYIILRNTDDSIQASYFDGSGWVSDINHLTGINTNYSSLDHSKLTLGNFISIDDKYILSINVRNDAISDNEYYFYEYTNETITESENVTIKLNDTSIINEFSVMVDDVSYSTINGTIITNLSLETSRIIDLEFYNITETGYGYYNNLTVINHLFNNELYEYTGLISKSYDKIILSVNDSSLNYSVNMNNINYSTTNGIINTNINITNLKSYNVTYFGFQDTYLYHDNEIIELNFTENITSYVLNWYSYYKNITFFAYNYNDSVFISNFSVNLDNSLSYNTNNGMIITDIKHDQLLYYDVLFAGFDIYNSSHHYENILYNNVMFSYSNNFITGNISILEIPFINTPPTTPTNLSFDLYPPIYNNMTMTVSGSGSTDIDLDIISYYYQFENSSDILRNYNLAQTLNLSGYENQTITVYTKAYDGLNYSEIIYNNFSIIEFNPPYVWEEPSYAINGTEIIKFGECPSTENGLNNMWLIIGFCLIMTIIGLTIKNVMMSLMGGAFIFFLSLIIMPCGIILGYIIMLSGLLIVISALAMKY